MRRRGFTLIELSIVMIIIGLIIGGVMKGKDLINSAEQKKIYNTWVKQWVVTANTYQDRTGCLIADGSDNGGTATGEDGHCDNVRLDNSVTVQNRLEAIGLDVPVSNLVTTGEGGAYNIKGKYATSATIAYFYWLNTGNGSRNTLYLVHLPTDVAIAFDKMTDGKIGSNSGDFRIYPSGDVWPNASTTNTVNATLEF
ncbi:MAG: prepilin-type N-terminal cleavage/methylation domain-containing protein [Sulfurimonas sp.]|nr:prepilin-type N-terminal cleavage/methylation domain-containing protein [Sulfurimonas sp.]